MSWLRDLAAVTDQVSTAEVAEALTRAGLQVERIESTGGDIRGPVVIGRVLEFVDEPQKNGKTIRWCQVDVGELNPEGQDGRGIVCGALNFEAGDHVVVALPGAELPGGFQIASRKTYGHVSDGMICAEDELGLGSDHNGIMVLPHQVDGRPLIVGEDALAVLHARDEVLEIDVTPDMGYCLSMRGIARETAQALGTPFDDPYKMPVPPQSNDGFPVRIESGNCSLFVALNVYNVDPDALTPAWLKHRLESAGMRSVSLPVDITNYVMLESGQPLHAYDADSLEGTIVVRQARAGEKLTTLDGVERDLDRADLLITDLNGPIGLAGVMGGSRTELSASTRNIVLEAACFDPVTIGRTFRRHRLFSEASKRFERGVDRALAYAAACRAAQLMIDLAGGSRLPDDETIAGGVVPMSSCRMDAALPAKILGARIGREQVIDILTAGGVNVTALGDSLTMMPPTWRPDLVDPYDYVEEVGRKFGFDNIGSRVPPAPVGRGLSAHQRARRTIGRVAAGAGFVELITLPFIGNDELAQLGLAEPDPRLATVRLANPLSDTQPFLRTTLLPGLFAAVVKNTSRSQDDLTLFEIGSVFRADGSDAAPMPAVDRRPGQHEVAGLYGSLPTQPLALGAVLTGHWRPADWRGPAVPADWSHAVDLVEQVAAAVGLVLTRRAAGVAPWHPGRCAEFLAGQSVVGHAGELHPGVCKAFGLPERTCAVEVDLDVLLAAAPQNGEIRPLSPFPLAKEDVALIVDAAVPAEQVRQALIDGAGELLESVSLFDVYTGPQVGEGKKSLAFGLRLRAADRTLTEADAAAARQGAVQAAVERFGAVQRA